MWDEEAIPLAAMRGQPSALTQVRRHPEEERKKFQWQKIRVDVRRSFAGVAEERTGTGKARQHVRPHR